MQTEYDQILEKMPEGILILGKDNKVEFMNVELRDVLNLDLEEECDEL